MAIQDERDEQRLVRLKSLKRYLPQELSWQDYLALGDQATAHPLVREFYYGKCLMKLDPKSDMLVYYNSVMNKYESCKMNSSSSSSSLSHRVLKLLSFDQSEFERFSNKTVDFCEIITRDFTLNWPHFSKQSILQGFSDDGSGEEEEELVNVDQDAQDVKTYINDTDNAMFVHCARFIKFYALKIHEKLFEKWNQFMEKHGDGDVPVTVELVQDFLTNCLPYYSMDKLQLMSQPHLFSHFVFEHLTNRSSILSFMSIISFLEHALQDCVYQSMNKQQRAYFEAHVPKFNDLLLMPELKQILGEDVIFLFRAFFGPLNSLNLRNVTIHGFISGGVGPYYENDEFHPCFTSFLIVLIASLNDYIAPFYANLRQQQQKVTMIPILSLIELRMEQERQEFAITNPNHIYIDASILAELMEPSSTEFAKLDALLSRSAFILPNWKNNWLFAIREYYLTESSQLRYYNFCTLVFPMLEHAIRRIFVSVNNCADRLLTAERNSYYTTLDILLSTIPSTFLPSNENYIFNDIAERSHALCNALFDLLIWPESLRTRDLIAHGNINPFTIDKRTADELLTLCLALCVQYDPLNTNLGHSVEYREQLPEIARFSTDYYDNVYEPSYHAFHSCQRYLTEAKTAIEQCEEFMSNHHLLVNANASETNQFDLIIQQKVQVLVSQLQQIDVVDSDNSCHTMWPVALSERQVKKAHLLRKTAQYCISISQQISNFSDTTLQKIENKTASSRQREQYALLKQYWKTFVCTTHFFYLCASKQFAQKEVDKWETKTKLCITCERLCSSLCSSIKANKWQRAIETCLAITQDCEALYSASQSLQLPPLQSLSLKEAKRLHTDLTPLIQTDIADLSTPSSI